MAALGGEMPRSWEEDLASLVEDTGMHFDGAAGDGGAPPMMRRPSAFDGFGETAGAAEESLREQVKGFLKAAGELAGELGRSCWEIARQSAEGVENSRAVKRLRGPAAAAAGKLRFLNEYLPEDRDPAHAWPVVILVFLIAFSGMKAKFIDVVQKVVERLVANEEQVEIMQELNGGIFPGAMLPNCDSKLRQMAMKILSQMASDGGCERNWSVFNLIHNKRNNRLGNQRLHDLVYVHYNLRLKEKLACEGQDEQCMDSIDLAYVFGRAHGKDADDEADMLNHWMASI